MSSAAISSYKRSRFRGRAHVPCWYCGKSLTKALATVDHKVAKSRGGANTRSNFVIACFECNHDKGAMPVEDFIQAREAAPKATEPTPPRMLAFGPSNEVPKAEAVEEVGPPPHAVSLAAGFESALKQRANAARKRTGR